MLHYRDVLSMDLLFIFRQKLLLFVIMIMLPVCAVGESVTERNMLQEFYNATNGASWSPRCLRGWDDFMSINDSRACISLPMDLGTITYSSLTGVECASPGVVTEIDLPSCNLTGTLPRLLFQSLSSLKSLIVNNNKLHGTLPSLGNTQIPHPLETIYFSDNAFIGRLPEDWRRMSSMRRLWGSNNQLNGSLPSSWSEMSRLSYVSLFANNLTGTLPPSWSTWKELNLLHLHQNQLSGTLPPSWSLMTSLQSFIVFDNHLSGTLPAEWATMGSLGVLSLSGNQFTGTLPSAWSSMTQLVELWLRQNQLEGPLPSEWSSLTKLKKLVLYGNALSGPIPSSWSSMVLEDVQLFDNQLSGPLPSSALVKLQTLYLHNNKFSGSLPPSWASMKLLERISLYQNQLSGTIPPEWSAWTKVEHLHLHNNTLSGSLPSSWASMISLKNLSLSSNHLAGTLPSEWSQLGTSLTGLYLESNKFTGTLPPSWSQLALLIKLYLTNNQLSGSLPSSWTSLQQLTILSLGSNSFTGSLPAEWASLKKLTHMALHENMFTGALPSAWSTMTSMENLHLNENELSGSLPPSWSSMLSLLTLYLDNNQLTGTLPLSLMKSLKILSMSSNNFEGSLPSEWSQVSTSLTNLYLGNNQLTGTLPPQWSGMQLLQVLDVSLNMLTGSLPLEWHQWTSMIAFHAAFNALEGTVPMEWNWTAIGTFNVSHNRLRYPLPLWVQSAAQSCDKDCVDLRGNCFDTRQVSWAVGTGWNRTLLTSLVNPVRPHSECQTTTATLSIPSATIEETVSYNGSTNTDTLMLSPSRSLPVVPPPAVVIGPTLGDSVAATVVSGPLASAALGAAAASTIQRAMLAMRVVACTYSTTSGIVPVGFSDNPLQLVVPGCGPSSQDHCGAVIGNCLILLIVAILAVCYGFIRSALRKGKEQQKDGPQSIGEWIATAGFPGRMLLPFAIVVQPTVASIVWLLGYGHGNAESVVIALVGTIVFAVFLGVYFVRIWRLVARRHSIPTTVKIYSVTAEAASAGVLTVHSALHWARKMIQRRTLWIVHPGYVGFELVHYSYQLKGWAAGFAKYREGRHMYSAVGLGMSIVAGIAGGVSLSNTAACDAVRYILLLVAVASLLLVVLLHPFASYLHQCCQATMEAIGLALAIATVLNDIEAVDIISRIQLGVGTAASILLMVTRYLDERWSKQKSEVVKENQGHDKEDALPLQEGQREWLDIVLQCGPPHSTNGRMRRLQILIQFAADRAMLESQKFSCGIEPMWLSAE